MRTGEFLNPMTSASPEEITARFEQLQKKLVRHWNVIRSMSSFDQTIVVVPSISLEFDANGAILQAYEERFLFLLLLLRQPRARLIYVTSLPIQPDIIDYYLSLMPGVIPSHARKRFFPVAVLDGSRRPLSRKILDRPALLERIRALVPNPDSAHLVPYNTTDLEKELAVRLGIPMYGTDPKHSHFGTKSGCRKLFGEQNIPHPIGSKQVHTVEDVVEAIVAVRHQRPNVRQVLTKLDEGVSGEGNALVDLEGIVPPGSPGERQDIERRVRTMKLESQTSTIEKYLETLRERGGVVEERIVGEEFRSPSVQMRVTPLGTVEILSTHDQVLGGASGQSYLGCRFPADESYSVEIAKHAKVVGERLAREGVLGRFAIDFVTARSNGEPWRIFAIELNLRKGGTTHPYLTLEFLTDGRYEWETGIFRSRSGSRKCYVASDHFESDSFRALTPDDLFDFVMREKLHFNHATHTGIVFHMMNSVTERGRFGLTAIGETHEEADAMYDRMVKGLGAEAARNLEDRGLG